MDIEYIAVGRYFSVCVDVEGHVWTFGYNNNSQFGYRDTKNRYIPTRVEGLDNIVLLFLVDTIIPNVYPLNTKSMLLVKINMVNWGLVKILIVYYHQY